MGFALRRDSDRGSQRLSCASWNKVDCSPWCRRLTHPQELHSFGEILPTMNECISKTFEWLRKNHGDVAIEFYPSPIARWIFLTWWFLVQFKSCSSTKASWLAYISYLASFANCSHLLNRSPYKASISARVFYRVLGWCRFKTSSKSPDSLASGPTMLIILTTLSSGSMFSYKAPV